MQTTQQIIEEFKLGTLDYLSHQGYPNLTWDEVMKIYHTFTDDPKPGLENEIDSCFAITPDDKDGEIILYFLNDESIRLNLL